MSEVRAVLWDMDGTIVDTEPYWIDAERQLVEQFGGTWTEEDGLKLVGNALPKSAEYLQAHGVKMEVREIIDWLTHRVSAHVAVEVPWRPGARELLAELYQAGVPCAMVTMSEGPLARIIAAALPNGTFEFLVTGEQVTKGKPDPEPYNTAFELLSEAHDEITKATVVAIEDSVPGVASAVASGVVTVSVPHHVPVPAGDTWSTWDTLDGKTIADLDELVRSRAGLVASE
ncbi:HAD family hydrolase [Neomicrococcus lactis]